MASHAAAAAAALSVFVHQDHVYSCLVPEDQASVRTVCTQAKGIFDGGLTIVSFKVSADMNVPDMLQFHRNKLGKLHKIAMSVLCAPDVDDGETTAHAMRGAMFEYLDTMRLNFSDLGSRIKEFSMMADFNLGEVCNVTELLLRDINKTFPNLERLSIKYKRLDLSYPWIKYCGSWPFIRELCIERTSISKKTLVELMTAMPQLSLLRCRRLYDDAAEEGEDEDYKMVRRGGRGLQNEVDEEEDEEEDEEDDEDYRVGRAGLGGGRAASSAPRPTLHIFNDYEESQRPCNLDIYFVDALLRLPDKRAIVLHRFVLKAIDMSARGLLVDVLAELEARGCTGITADLKYIDWTDNHDEDDYEVKLDTRQFEGRVFASVTTLILTGATFNHASYHHLNSLNSNNTKKWHFEDVLAQLVQSFPRLDHMVVWCSPTYMDPSDAARSGIARSLPSLKKVTWLTSTSISYRLENRLENTQPILHFARLFTSQVTLHVVSSQPDIVELAAKCAKFLENPKKKKRGGFPRVTAERLGDMKSTTHIGDYTNPKDLLVLVGLS